ncbi:MAG TPA: EAL domain-containing protein [Chromatiaceae bacterium]|jgi:diguanylate cyclase (GGDEF)-like protein/PAS domain S-box-containing protein|nr:EAL domain-containing protein [Chromatiaceae bacterium]HIA08410.1 EAL domain-containing protein [Chromatiaceae bacterium]HIO13748.1 EAL domain-containing protein [Chromatiales bacterium]HIO55265.1 EAL domain-containing protein [Chromatiales bacterium]
MTRQVFSWTERAIIATLGVIFVALIVGAFALFLFSREQAEFEQAAESFHQSLVEKIAGANAVSTAMMGFYQSSDELSDSELTAFTQTLLTSYPHVSSISFGERVSGQAISEFTDSMLSRGLYGFKVQQYNPVNGRIEAASPKPEYFPVRFLEPFEPSNAATIGLDVSTIPGVARAIRHAVESGEMDTSQTPTGVWQGSEYVAVQPTYYGRFAPLTSEQRKRQISGIFLVAVDLDSVFGVKESAASFSVSLRGERDSGSSMGTLFEWRESNASSSISTWLPRLEATHRVRLGSELMALQIARAMRISSSAESLLVGITGMALVLVIGGVRSVRARRLQEIERQQSREELYRERERAEVTLHSIGDGVITVDTEGAVLFMNPIAEELTGWKNRDAHKQKIDNVVCLVDEHTARPLVHEEYCHMSGAAAGRNLLLRRPDGRTIAIKNTASALTNSSGQVIGTVCVLHDISTERELTNALAYQARHDPLTGLANRREFERRLHAAYEDSERNLVNHVVCYIDLDQFKLVNDTCGHSAGDRLLKQVSKLLQLQIRKQDVLARLGGDEFGVLLVAADMETAVSMAERLREVVEEYRHHESGQIFSVRASIGVVEVNSQSGSIGEIMSAADLACYAAKDAGRNTVHVCTEGDVEVERRQGEMKWLPRIQTALSEDRFQLYMQPIIPLGDDGYPLMREFLLRLIDLDGSVIGPGPFIPAAERYGLMKDLDRWVIHTAFKIIAQRADAADEGDTESVYTINLSGQSMSDAGAAAYISDQLATSGANPAQICFEITETAAISDISEAAALIDQVRNEGCKFALDDFGSGLSSFGYLKHLPVDFIKIDGQFVKDMVDDRVDRAMVWAIQDVGEALGITTIAEFVENEETLEMLKLMGIHYAQGFHIARPEPVLLHAKVSTDSASAQQ